MYPWIYFSLGHHIYYRLFDVFVDGCSQALSESCRVPDVEYQLRSILRWQLGGQQQDGDVP